MANKQVLNRHRRTPAPLPWPPSPRAIHLGSVKGSRKNTHLLVSPWKGLNYIHYIYTLYMYTLLHIHTHTHTHTLSLSTGAAWGYSFYSVCIKVLTEILSLGTLIGLDTYSNRWSYWRQRQWLWQSQRFERQQGIWARLADEFIFLRPLCQD